MLKNINLPSYSLQLPSFPCFADLVTRLPAIEMVELANGEIDYYGASHQISKSLGLVETLKKKANWEHGWKHGDVRRIDQIGPYRRKDRVHLVSCEAHKKILNDEGFDQVHATGLPYLYAPDPSSERLKGSLLVCPGHTSNFSTGEWSNFAKSYAESINAIRDDFDEILLCVTANCIEQQKWIHEFEAVGIPWILGASIYDRNALERMRLIFSSFEFVTSNMIGSHLVYAGYEGCKISIWGWQNLYDPSSFKVEPIYQKFEALLRDDLKCASYEWVYEKYGFLFHEHPREAVSRKEWSEDQLGVRCKKSAPEVADYFGWLEKELGSRLRGISKCNFSLSSISDKELKKTERLRKARWKRQKKQLLRAPRYSDGFVDLFGRPFRYIDTHSLTYTVDHIFNRGVYAFDSGSKTPLIIDAGANIGVSMLYFKRRFPDSKIICFEPDPKVFSALEMNARTYELEDCELHRAALWSGDRVLEFCSEGADAGAISEVGGSGTPTLVRALDLLPFLQAQPVDFLKMDIEGAEVEVLQACQSGLKNVQRIFIEYHSFEGSNQRLAELFQILEGAGFRLHLNNAGLCSKQPMLGVDTYLGMDMQFDLFGYRI